MSIAFSYLKCIQNWFVASLALADLTLGIFIMPFSLAQEIVGYWLFGEFWCQIHSALDVLLCTASILNLTLISLDRYWLITRAVEYLSFRTRGTVAFMICSVWGLSALVSLPLLLYPPWRLPFKPPRDDQIKFTTSDRQLFHNLNTTEELIYSKCSVSTNMLQLTLLNLTKLLNLLYISF